ncbi:hypothetical protein [Burkholderia contaminans]|uniref:hypothetical protein n=1 Tax=Burkholderia contaminans TaxID=488447 RepID=UPI001588DCDF|nr:hypothetical protein [Burkholderia contaminans]
MNITMIKRFNSILDEIKDGFDSVGTLTLQISKYIWNERKSQVETYQVVKLEPKQLVVIKQGEYGGTDSFFFVDEGKIQDGKELEAEDFLRFYEEKKIHEKSEVERKIQQEKLITERLKK